MTRQARKFCEITVLNINLVYFEITLNFLIYTNHKHTMHIFVKVNAGLLTLLYVATKVMQEEMIKNVSNIEKYQPVSLLND